jgi:6-phosphogluconolactonase
MTSIRVLVCLCAAALAVSGVAAEHLVWFGTYTGPKTGSEGVYVARFDAATGAVSVPRLATAAHSPSFLALHPTLPVLYAVADVVNDAGTRSGAVQAFAVDAATGSLAPLNHQPAGGSGPCHVAVDAGGRVALAANYGGGSAICLGLAADGSLQPVVAGQPGGFLQHVYDRTSD